MTKTSAKTPILLGFLRKTAEVGLEAGRVLQDPRWGEADNLAVQILETIREHGWVCGEWRLPAS